MTADDVEHILAGMWPDQTEQERARAELSRYGTS